MVRIASFNVENLFARPKTFNTSDWTKGKDALDWYREVNELIQKTVYSAADKQQIRELLRKLEIYKANSHGAIRRHYSDNPKWAWLRKNRGKFDREPKDTTKDVEIIASGRSSWIGWVELATEPLNETGTKMTAQVIKDVGADIIGIVEAEDRPSLARFNKDMLGESYAHVMLIDGNDSRGIDVGIMLRNNFEIESILSNVDAEDAVGQIFSRDCPQYKVRTPNGTKINVLVNHFKSQSGGGDTKRQRQAAKVRNIIDNLIGLGEHVIVLGDLNEGPKSPNNPAPNLTSLYDNNSPLIDCYSLLNFDTGKRPGSFDSCGLSNRFDYIFISWSLQQSFVSGGIFRKGLWGSRKTKPTDWDVYPEMTKSVHQASDHGVVYIDLDI